MKTRHLAITTARRRWIIPASIAGFIALSWIIVATAIAHGDRHKDRKVTVEVSGEHKAFLGVMMQDLDEEVLNGLDTSVKRGVLITDVVKGSPADEAGIEDGDIIIEFNGKKVSSADELRDLVAEQEIGDKIDVKIARGKKTETIEVALGDWADQPAFVWSDGDDTFEFLAPHWDRAKHYVSSMMPRRLGVRVSNINEDLGDYFGVDEGEGLLVLGVEDESTASVLGIKAGDVIVEVEGEEIHSSGDIHKSLEDLEEGDEVNVTVVRKKKRVNLEAELEDNGTASWHRGWGSHPRVRAFTMPHDNDLRKELDELRKEVEELKKELEKS